MIEAQTDLRVASVVVQRREHKELDLIEVWTADGLIGHGEGAWCEEVLRDKPELVVGRSAFEMESIFEDLAASGQTPGGLDIALWDLAGKALDMPVSGILGKTYRTRVQVRGSFPESDAAPIAAGLSLLLDDIVRDLLQNQRVDIAMQDVARCGTSCGRVHPARHQCHRSAPNFCGRAGRSSRVDDDPVGTGVGCQSVAHRRRRLLRSRRSAMLTRFREGFSIPRLTITRVRIHHLRGKMRERFGWSLTHSHAG